MPPAPVPHHRRTPRRARAVLALVPLLGIGALTACGGPAASASKGAPVRVSLSAANGVKTVQAGDKLQVSAEGGRLVKVVVTDPKGRRLPGGLGDGGRVWTSHEPTVPDTRYSVAAEARNAQGGTNTVKESLTTAQADQLNKLVLNPGSQGATVGVAQPVSVTFDFPVTDKAAVEKHLKVTTDNGTAGSWGWVKDFSGKDRVDWRPKEYWRPGTKVGLRADLNGVDSGGGRYFAKDYDLNFTIGDRHVITVDLDSKQLTFTENGKEVKNIPFSAGKPDPRHSTWTGIFPLMAKEGTIIMDSGTAGPGDADERTVRDAMKLTSSGTYAHAAPWNAGKVGRVNDSSGCIGLTDADADWLYSKVRVGDPFEVIGSSERGKAAENNGLGDWMVDWPQWQKKSALPSSS
ncbi:Ig-like domain-containing protein [Streptomyces chrestomyceticus]|uniref:L,D-transpeptidase n=1 Tax=Streptomyces chrestomyceticus TaxID=68185 RepID=UPI0036C3DB71